jgi:hypothetical protein
VAELTLIGIVVVVSAAIALTSSSRGAGSRGEEPIDAAKVEREVYEKLDGARRAEDKAAEAPRLEPKPGGRPPTTRGIDANRPAPGEAAR